MNAKERVFFDTDILVYLQSIDEPQKQLIAKSLVDSCAEAFISTQILNELSNVLIEKKYLAFDMIREVIMCIAEAYVVKVISADTVVRALFVMEKYQLAYYDSLIIASALEANCTVLYSENLSDGLVLDKKLKVRNPFKSDKN
jgi:predicted nucleic acid-binding protein